MGRFQDVSAEIYELEEPGNQRSPNRNVLSKLLQSNYIIPHLNAVLLLFRNFIQASTKREADGLLKVLPSGRAQTMMDDKNNFSLANISAEGHLTQAGLCAAVTLASRLLTH